MTRSRLLIGLLQPLLALLLLAGVPLPGAAPSADARVAVLAEVAKGLVGQRDGAETVRIGAPDDRLDGGEPDALPGRPAAGPPLGSALSGLVAAPPRDPPPSRRRAPAAPPTGPPFA